MKLYVLFNCIYNALSKYINLAALPISGDIEPILVNQNEESATTSQFSVEGKQLVHAGSQEGVHNLLWTNTDKLSQDHAAVINDHYVAIVQNLDIESVWPYLVADGVLSPEQQELIMGQPSLQAKRRHIISIVKKRGEMGFYSLRNALMQTRHGGKGRYEFKIFFSLVYMPIIKQV